MTSWSEIVTLVLKMLVAQYQTHGFWNWEPFSRAPARPKSEEKDGRAVGDQGLLQEVKY